MKVGQPATITHGGLERAAGGQGDGGEPRHRRRNSTTVQVWVQADNPGERLKPGTSVHVAIVTEAIKATPVVPAAAILPGEEGGTRCSRFTPTTWRTARGAGSGVREGDKVQILSGVRRASRW